MKYQVIKNANGKIVAFGPDDGMYDHVVKSDEVLSYEDKMPKLDSMASNAEAAEKATARQAVLDRLGITADEAALLLG